MNHAKLSAKENANADTSNIRNALRCLKVVGGLLYLSIKFYLLAWFYIPKLFLTNSKAPTNLDELEYGAKNHPVFLIVIALFAINLSCFAIYVLYVIPLEMLAKHF
jgi:hypothetical protein